ncbi:homeobox protein Hox-A4-like [Schistocerca gregaria]|uniref:homeobox protein Hox-A4-like n=1 Tax=Schistocerca gregaria TaxID=7010 RepID=UPI00211DF835|nr:homeobox protein Hox-A4-like [Schistocerca gregaria]
MAPHPTTPQPPPPPPPPPPALSTPYKNMAGRFISPSKLMMERVQAGATARGAGPRGPPARSHWPPANLCPRGGGSPRDWAPRWWGNRPTPPPLPLAVRRRARSADTSLRSV